MKEMIRKGSNKIPIAKEFRYLSCDREKMSHEMNMHLSLINLRVCMLLLSFSLLILRFFFCCCCCCCSRFACVLNVLFDNHGALNVCECIERSLRLWVVTHTHNSSVCFSLKHGVWRWHYHQCIFGLLLFYYKIIRSAVNMILYWVNIPKRRLLSMTKYLTSRFVWYKSK